MIDRNILKNKFAGEILFDEKMSNHTSYGVGGRVNAYIRPKNKPELIQIIKLIHKSNWKRAPERVQGLTTLMQDLAAIAE